VAQVEEYTSLINDNIIYYIAAVLDPPIKCTLIREQYGEDADDIIKRIREYLKTEYQKKSPTLIDIQFVGSGSTERG
jgi:hypothetical protein